MLKHKYFAAFAALVLVAETFSVPASASGAAAGMISVGTFLNVRSAGNTGAGVIGRLYDGAQVTVVGSVNGWDEITYSGKAGWVAGQYVLTGKIRTAVMAAESQLGVPYRYGAESAGQAFDCSGLTKYAYGKAGVGLPHSATDQAGFGWTVSRNALRPGDLLFFDPHGSGTISHCGIYIGYSMFISAQSGAGKVMKANLTSAYWSGAFVTARRLAG